MAFLHVTMINKIVVFKIQELYHKEKMSLRKIAKELKISRGTVTSVVRGEHRLQRIAREEDQIGIVFPSGEAKRCDKCGRLVKPPCLACQLEEIYTKRKTA